MNVNKFPINVEEMKELHDFTMDAASKRMKGE